MIFQFVKTNILSKKLRNFLAIFSIAISVILIIAVQNVTEQLSSNIKKNAGYYDVIVGAPGSETQLILSTIFYYDSPIANIDISYYEELQKNMWVKSVVPIGMGDNYRGYRLIGTKSNFFEDTDTYKLKEGKIFENEKEVVLGSTVAKITGLKIGDTFSSEHGLAENAAEAATHNHSDFKYVVVGILEPTKTPNDTVIFTDIENLWAVHGMHHHEEGEEHEEVIEAKAPTMTHGTTQTENNTSALITALLVRSKGINEYYLLSNKLSEDSNIQAINPTETLRKLLNTLDIGGVIVTIVAAIAVGLSIIMLFTTMLSSSLEKMKDISILRALGANRKTVFAIILLEAFIIALCGAVIGFVVAHVGIGILGNYTAQTYGLDVSAFNIASGEIIAIVATMLLSVVAGMIPGMMVYKADATRYIK